MSYKRKNGDVISRADYEKIQDKDLLKEFSPSNEVVNKSYDGEDFDEVKADEVDAVPPASTPAKDDK